MTESTGRKDRNGYWKRLGWLGVVLSIVINACLYGALAFVNQRIDGRVEDVPVGAFHVYTPPREIVEVVVEEERVEFKPKIESKPMESMEALAVPIPITPRIPVTNTDVFDVHAIPVTVTDIAVSSPLQVGPMDIPDVDTPPRRTRGSLPPYPGWAESAGLEARVKLHFVVEVDGTVSNIRVGRLDGDERFRALAVSAVRKWIYQPGKYRSRAVPVRCTKELVFRFLD